MLVETEGCSADDSRRSGKKVASASIRPTSFLPGTLAINSRSGGRLGKVDLHRREPTDVIIDRSRKFAHTLNARRSPGTVGDPLHARECSLSHSLSSVSLFFTSLISLPCRFILCSSGFTLETAASVLLYLINTLPFSVRSRA